MVPENSFPVIWGNSTIQNVLSQRILRARVLKCYYIRITILDMQTELWSEPLLLSGKHFEVRKSVLKMVTVFSGI